MEMTEIKFGDQPPIDAYGPGFFRVNEQVYEGGVLILPDGEVRKWGGWSDLDAITGAAKSVDVLFLGTGANIAPLPAKAQKALEEADVPFDVMSSPSAARTYNVLLSEGRRVAVAVLPV